jgi:hypothetical protein
MTPSAASEARAAEAQKQQEESFWDLGIDRELLLLITIGAGVLLCLMACCTYYIGTRRRGEDATVVCSAKHLLTRRASLNYGHTPVPGTQSLAKSSLVKWELEEISEHGAGDSGREVIRSEVSLPERRPRRDAPRVGVADSMDAGSRGVRESSYWEVGDSVQTAVLGGSEASETVVDMSLPQWGVRRGAPLRERQRAPDAPFAASREASPARGDHDAPPVAVASSLESVGMRIPAALRWSASPPSRGAAPPSPARSSGGSLLQRLRSAGKSAVRSEPAARHPCCPRREHA